MKITLNNRHKAGLFLTTVVAGLCLILGETIRETLGAIIIGFALTWAFGSTSRVLRYCIGGLGILLFLVPLIAGFIDHHDAMQSYELSLDIFHTQLPQFAKDHPDLSAGLLTAPASAHDPLADKWTPVPTSKHDWFAKNAPTHSGTGTQAQTSGDPYAAYGGSVAKQPAEWNANGDPIPTPIHKQYLDDNGNPIPVDYDSIAKKHGGVVLDFSKAQPINRVLAVPNIGNVSFPSTMSDKDIAKTLRADSGNNRAPDWYLEALDAGISPDDINQLTPPLDKPKAFDLKHVISDGALIEVPSALLAILFFGSVIAESKRFTGRFNRPVES
jgi:hypothetical protein